MQSSDSNLAHESAALLRSPSPSVPALLGFDGFVDTICDAVETRHSATSYSRIPTLLAFGERIALAAGKSANVEIVPTLVKLGGNGPIMANALSALGLDVTYCGMTGHPHPHEVFAEFSQRAKLLPICDPAFTDAYEFDDGKLIVGKHATVAQVSWDSIAQNVGREVFAQAWQEARFVGVVNWTMLPFMTQLWRAMHAELPQDGERKTLFFDLADPEKRSRQDIFEALGTIALFQQHHDVILGLNEKEALQVGQTLDISTPLGDVLDHETAPELAAAIRARLEIGVVVVHPTRFAASASSEEAACVNGPWIANPLISTGAGDHFNAGFCLGQLLGGSLAQSLQIGVGTSGFYVRSAKSPSKTDLAGFLEEL
jgi:sugar/nucleoside kinase (ribokinase family)